MELLVEPSEVESVLWRLDEYEKIYVGPSRLSLVEGLLLYCHSDEVFRNILEDESLFQKLTSPKFFQKKICLTFHLVMDISEWVPHGAIFALAIPRHKWQYLTLGDYERIWDQFDASVISNARLIVKYWDNSNTFSIEVDYRKLLPYLYRTQEGIQFIFQELWQYVNKMPTITYDITIREKQSDVFWLLLEKGVPIDGLEEVINATTYRIMAKTLYDYEYDGFMSQYWEPLYLAGMELIEHFRPNEDEDDDPIIYSPFREEIKQSRKFFASRLLWTSPCFAPGAWWARTSYLLGGVTYQIVDTSFS